MIPGEALIYERFDGVVYARYRDPPNNKLPRWIVGGDPGAITKTGGGILNYSEWQELCTAAEKYPTLKNHLDKLIILYYTVKDNTDKI